MALSHVTSVWALTALTVMSSLAAPVGGARGQHRRDRDDMLRMTGVKHERNLIWAQADEDVTGVSRLVAINGDPEEWVPNRTATTHYITAPNARWRFVGLAFDYRRQTIFWSDTGNKKIQGLLLNGTSVPFVLFDGISNRVEGLALDWLAGNIYWTDALYNWIIMAPAQPDTHLFRMVVSTGLDHPTGLAVHPMEGLLFWSDWGAVPKIERSDLSGRFRRPLVESGLVRPMGLTIDFQEGTVFWIEQETGTISSVDLQGEGRITYFTVEHTKFFGLALYKDYIFTTDQEGQQLYVFNRKTKKHEVNFGLGAAVPYNIIMYDVIDVNNQSAVPCHSIGCDHMCVSQYGGSLKCACASGFQLQADGRTCVDDGKYSTPVFMYSIGDALCRFPGNLPDMNLDHISLETQCFLTNRKEALALAFNVRENALYFAENDSRTISKVKLSIEESPEILIGGIGLVEGIAVDWLAANMYWTDATSRVVMVAKTDGRFQKTLITEGLDWPRGLYADAVNRYLFWTDVGSRPKIERSYLDGTLRRVIVSDDLGSPNHLIVDYKTERLFWTDSILERIESIDLDGGHRSIVSSLPGSSLYGIAIFQDFIIWTDRGRRHGIHAGLKETGEKIRGIVHPNIGLACDVITFDPSVQPLDNSPCDPLEECRQLCLPGPDPRRGTCHCAMGYREGDSGKICLSDPRHDNFILFTDTYHKEIYQVDALSGDFNAISLSGHDNPIGVDFDPGEHKVYWTDVAAKVIKRSKLDGAEEEIVKLLSTDSVPDGIALDSISRLLYYTDAGKSVIATLTLNNKYHVTLVEDSMDKPRAIALDPIRGLMFWTDWGQRSRIERADMNGDHRQILMDTGSGAWPNGLTIDIKRERIYWVNAKADTIESCDYAGEDAQLLYHELKSHFFGITLLEDTVFYTDWTKKSLMKLDKTDSGYRATAIGPSVFARANDIHGYKRDYTTTGRLNGCSTENGGCPFVCIPVPQGRVCACPDGYFIQYDAISCVAGVANGSNKSHTVIPPLAIDSSAAMETPDKSKSQSLHNPDVGSRGSTRGVLVDKNKPPASTEPSSTLHVTVAKATVQSTMTSLTTTTTAASIRHDVMHPLSPTVSSPIPFNLNRSAIGVTSPLDNLTTPPSFLTAQTKVTDHERELMKGNESDFSENRSIDDTGNESKSAMKPPSVPADIRWPGTRDGSAISGDVNVTDGDVIVTDGDVIVTTQPVTSFGFGDDFSDVQIHQIVSPPTQVLNGTGNGTKHGGVEEWDLVGLTGLLAGGVVLMLIIITLSIVAYKKLISQGCRRGRRTPGPSVPNFHATYELPLKDAVLPEVPPASVPRTVERYSERGEIYYSGTSDLGTENPAFIRRDANCNTYEEIGPNQPYAKSAPHLRTFAHVRRDLGYLTDRLSFPPPPEPEEVNIGNGYIVTQAEMHVFGSSTSAGRLPPGEQQEREEIEIDDECQYFILDGKEEDPYARADGMILDSFSSSRQKLTDPDAMAAEDESGYAMCIGKDLNRSSVRSSGSHLPKCPLPTGDILLSKKVVPTYATVKKPARKACGEHENLLSQHVGQITAMHYAPDVTFRGESSFSCDMPPLPPPPRLMEDCSQA